MLALLQRFITLSLVTIAFGWLFYFSRSAPVLAAAGFLVIGFGYAAFLALEFLLASQINKSDAVLQPGSRALFSAWLAETMIAPQVFCWRQPFFPNSVPDQLVPSQLVQGRRGVIFIHGFFCNRGFWTPWLKHLQGWEHAFIAVNLQPVFASIDHYAPQIEDAVRRVTLATGQPPLLVCHSMGGLAARAWLKLMNAEARVHHVVTIGTPHHGTWLARFGYGRNGRQMRLLSNWLKQLNHQMPSYRSGLFTCWYSNCDNIVFPASTATLAGAYNRLVHGAAHVQLAFAPQVMRATLALLEDGSSGCPASSEEHSSIC